jgi:hypothetical protein
MAPVRSVLHRLSCSKETVRNAPKHEFWVQWSGSHAFVAKKANATSFIELVVNGASSSSFASTFVQQRNGPKRQKHEFWFQWSGSGTFVVKNSDMTSFSELVR